MIWGTEKSYEDHALDFLTRASVAMPWLESKFVLALVEQRKGDRELIKKLSYNINRMYEIYRSKTKGEAFTE